MIPLKTEQLKKMRARNADIPVINVLARESHAERHIPDTENVPGDDDAFVDKVEKLAGDKSRPVVVYCASEECTASPKAAKKLEQAGFAEVYDYEGGIEAWKKAGERLEGSAAA